MFVAQGLADIATIASIARGEHHEVIADAQDAPLFVPWFEVNEVNGRESSLHVEIFDGVRRAPLASDNGAAWAGRSASPQASYLFTRGYEIPLGSQLKVYSSDPLATFHVHGVLGHAFRRF